MAGSTQFRHYLIAQDAGGKNIEVVRSAEQVGVLAFDVHRLVFVHFHVLLEPLKNRAAFDERARRLQDQGHRCLARLLDFGEDEGSPFYITASVDGETLRGYLERAESLPVWLAMRLTCAALEAVRALAAAGDFLPTQPLDGLRLVQTGPQGLMVSVADFRVPDDAGAKAKQRQTRSPLEKQGQFLVAFFQEQLQSGVSPTDSMLHGPDFTELLQNLLQACGPEKAEAMASLAAEVAALVPPVPSGELAAPCKPRPYLAAHLASITDLARSVGASVRVQSQKINAAQPYAMRGSLLRMGQEVVVEQVPPPRLTGTIPAEILRQVLNLPKTGKFPNLVPVLFVEENDGILGVAETAVEGVTLQELLDARSTLGVEEIYLVLAGVDTALGQLEKAGLPSRQLRLEDVFLFTGFGKESPRDNGLITRRLNEWPGFSVVIRAHPCLHAMSGRGTDPALLLPVPPAQPDGDAQSPAESPWSGGWMAALGCFLAGMPDGKISGHESGIAETDAVCRLLEEEVQRARQDTAVTRAAFLAKYARVMQQHDVSKLTPGPGKWTELSGSSSDTTPAASQPALRTAAPPPFPAATASAPAMASPPEPEPELPAPPPQAELRKVAPLPEKRPPHVAQLPALPQPQPPRPTIGFAEALIRQPQMGAPEDAFEPGGLRPTRSPAPQDYDSESSWSPMHESMPFWMRFALLFVGSLLLGAGLAHLSGRALWQEPEAPRAVMVETPPDSSAPVIDLPVAPKQPSASPSSGAPKLPPPPDSMLKDVNLDPPRGTPPPKSPGVAGSGPSLTPPAPSTIPPAPAGTPSPSPTLTPSPPPSATPASPTMTPDPVPAVPDGSTASLEKRLSELRRTGAKLPPTLRQETDRAAAAGSPEAMLALGRLSVSGQAGPPNPRTAFLWYERAEQTGYAPAKFALAECYLQGLGVQEDLPKAVELLNAAVSAGDAPAADLLGVCYARGKGVPRDDARAFALCSRAYEAGVTSACGNLGVLYQRGQGVPADAARAVELFAEGSNRGHAESMMLYARSLEYGTGIPADRELAEKWYQKAASLGNAEAADWCKSKGVVY